MCRLMRNGTYGNFFTFTRGANFRAEEATAHGRRSVACTSTRMIWVKKNAFDEDGGLFTGAN